MQDTKDIYDILVIGGGINGTGIARDAAGRNLSVLLCEKDDLAQGTSSRSGKLIHGGLRYLEYYEFQLVRKALIEREVLLRNAPHIVWPMRFILPHAPSTRPAWLVRLGLLLYDHLGGREKLPRSCSIDLLRDPCGATVKNQYRVGFEYSDCWVDDSRLVVLNAFDAAARGAKILTRTRCDEAVTKDGLWKVRLTDMLTKEQHNVYARAIVNAAGPWVNDVVQHVFKRNTPKRNVRLVRGSHLITQKFWKGEHAFLIQNDDKRVIFINPYEGDKALIGTTDIPMDGDPDDARIDNEEIDYIIAAVNRYFKKQLTHDDVLETFSGVRPLFDDGQGNPSAVTRDYVLELETIEGASFLNVYGGKITTYRKLAEHTIRKLGQVFSGIGPAWTADVPLPGGEIADADFETFLFRLQAEYRHLPNKLVEHYARLYGNLGYRLLENCQTYDDLGKKFGPLFYEIEARYLIEHEWAKTTEDIIWRRTKHQLHMSKHEIAVFDIWFKEQYQNVH